MVKTSRNDKGQRVVYLVDGARTPFLKAKAKAGPFTAADLAVGVCKSLLLRQPFKPSELDEVITGCMMPAPNEANIARIIALRLGCGKTVPAWTVQRNCASGLQAIDNAYQDIASGRHDLVLAGGTEAMSHAPLLLSQEMSAWMGQWFGAKSFTDRLGLLTQIKLSYLKPIVALMQGLTDPLVGLNMGQTAENIAYRFGIDRESMDNFALRSHQRLATAIDNKHLEEIEPLYDGAGQVYLEDEGLRRDSSLEKLAKLAPYFDKKFGMVTAANSSQVTDGAAFLILASEVAVKQYKLKPLAKIVDVEWAGLAPEQMGLGPVHAITPILQRQSLALNDVDTYEINEAFAAQVIGCLRAWEDEDYCREQLGLSAPLGTLDENKLNVDGGAIAIGHPVGASGARVLLHTLEVLKRQQGRYGIASLCIGGGQGGAMLIERLEGERA